MNTIAKIIRNINKNKYLNTNNTEITKIAAGLYCIQSDYFDKNKAIVSLPDLKFFLKNNFQEFKDINLVVNYSQLEILEVNQKELKEKISDEDKKFNQMMKRFEASLYK